MIPTAWKIGASAALAVLLVWGGLALANRMQRGHGVKAEAQAQEFKGEANAHQAQAQAADVAVAKLQVQVSGQTTLVERLQAERQALLRKLAATSTQPGVVAPMAEGPCSSGLPPVVVALIAKDKETIEAQAKENAGLKNELAAALTARDDWKATAELRERQASAQEAATKAWKDAVTASRWQGRIEGALAGAALGYLGGRKR